MPEILVLVQGGPHLLSRGKDEFEEDREGAVHVLLRAQRVIAHSKRVARVPIRSLARRTELEDAVEDDVEVEDTSDLCSGGWGAECVDPSSAV